MSRVIKFLDDPFEGYGLTKKQAEAARLVAIGHSVKEVSEKLGITRNAVIERLNPACAKLGVPGHGNLTLWLTKKQYKLFKGLSDGL